METDRTPSRRSRLVDTLPPMPEVIAALHSSSAAVKEAMSREIFAQCAPKLLTLAGRHFSQHPHLREEAVQLALMAGLRRMVGPKPPTGQSTLRFLVGCLGKCTLKIADQQKRLERRERRAAGGVEPDLDDMQDAGPDESEEMDEDGTEEWARDDASDAPYVARRGAAFDPSQHGRGPDERADARRRLEEIWADIEELPRQQREVMKLKIQLRSTASIARELGIAKKTVEETLRVARRKLRGFVEERKGHE